MKAVSISQVDALFASGSYPIEFLLAYSRGFPTGRIRRALRKLAPVFWPVFGEYARGVISYDRYREEEFFDEASVGRGLDLAELEAGGPEAASRYRPGSLTKLFFLKATRFTDGLVLVPKMSHVAGDGYSYFLFLSALAALTRASFFPFRAPLVTAMFKPHHRRTALGEFSFQGGAAAPAAPEGRLTVESIEVPKREVQDMVKAAAADGLRVSSNDVLSAVVVRKLAGLPGGSKRPGLPLTVPIDVRSKVPEYGRRYFGNGIWLHRADLDRAGAAGLPVIETAARIRSSMPEVTKESYVRYLEGLERAIAEKRWDEFRPYDPDTGCLVTNLSKLPAESLDFGAGGPGAIVPLTADRNGAAILSRRDRYVLIVAY